jgi:putative OPT family oligopeptide transporter
MWRKNMAIAKTSGDSGENIQKEHKGLPHTAYEPIPGEEYQPYIPDDAKITEFSVLSAILGIILSVVFGVAMVYVGLKIGMTISASIPAAVMSMGILRGIFRKGNILENNIVQTITSAGESLAAGVIFTIPAIFLWRDIEGFQEMANSFTVLRLVIVAVIGGVLGILLMIPLRKYLIVKEHGKLLYPEGTACAEVLVAGDVGGNPAKLVFSGILVGAVYTFLQKACKLWEERIHFELPYMRNGEFSGELTPILLGVGYIIGLDIACIMVAGGALAWMVLIPLISYFGANIHVPIAPAVMPISEMSAYDVWNNYIRYIGAGAVAVGGLISLAKSMPVIISSFKSSFREFRKTIANNIADGTSVDMNAEETRRTDQDLPLKWILAISAVLIILIVLTKNISNNYLMGIVGSLLVFVFGFFFVTVSSRIVGIVGSSSNPVSGMTIATLIISTLIFRALGYTGIEGMVTSLLVGAFACIAMAMAGDISQDLKTGFLIGATPKKQQLGQIIGVTVAAFFVILMVKSLSPMIISGELKAPQANLMSMVIQGIMEGSLPWSLVIAGGFIACVVELLKIPALPFAVGLYLPLELSTPLIVGGLLAHFTRFIYKKPQELKERIEKGVLVSSGLIAGDALMGLVVIALVASGVHLEKFIRWPLAQYQLTTVIVFGLLTYFIWRQITSGKTGTDDNQNMRIQENETEKTND